MWGEIGKFVTAAAIVGLGALAALFLISPAVDLLDYGRAFQFYDSPRNRLYIETTGRLKVAGREYLALANHPREATFDRRVDAYSGVIEDAGGASTITFIMEAGNAVIERRHQAPQPSEVQHQCRPSPFGNSASLALPKVNRLNLVELKDFNDILQSAAKRRKLYGVMTYNLEGRTASVDFPAALVNINPRGPNAHPEERWQLVATRLPLYVGGDPACEGIREGSAAIRTFDGPIDLVYLCRGPDGSNDFTCHRRVNARVRLFTTRL